VRVEKIIRGVLPLAALLLWAAACHDDLERVKVPCGIGQACPSGYTCKSGRCEKGDAGKDARVDGPAKDSAQDGLIIDGPLQDGPTKDAPVVDGPLTDAPVVDGPLTDAPVVDGPHKDAPAADAPVVDGSLQDAPVVDAPLVDGPAIDTPLDKALAQPEAALEQSVPDLPAVKGPLPDLPDQGPQPDLPDAGPQPTVKYNVCSKDKWCWVNPLPQGETLYGLWVAGNGEVFAAGYKASMVVHFDGTTWTGMDTGKESTLYEIWGSSPRDMFVVGHNGTILRRKLP